MEVAACFSVKLPPRLKWKCNVHLPYMKIPRYGLNDLKSGFLRVT